MCIQLWAAPAATCLFVCLIVCLVYGPWWSVVDFTLLRMEPTLPEALKLQGPTRAGRRDLFRAPDTEWLGLHHFCFQTADTLAHGGQGCRQRCGEVAMMGLGRY